MAPVDWILGMSRDLVTVHMGPQHDGAWRDVKEIRIGQELPLPRIGTTIPAAALLRPATH